MILVFGWTPFWSWLLVFLPLFLLRTPLTRWPWYTAALCGAVVGSMVMLLSHLVVDYSIAPFAYALLPASVAIQFALGTALRASTRGRPLDTGGPTLPAV